MQKEQNYNPNLIVLYSKDVEKSEAFYQNALDRKPIAKFEGFALFQISDQMQLGIQAESDILPQATGPYGGFELCISDVSIADVNALCEQWKAQKFHFILEPQHLEFGYTAVITDPDGHRLRICATDTSGLQER